MKFLAAIRNSGKKIGQFVADIRAELKKVIWPSWRNTWILAGVVVVSIVMVGVVLWGTDALLTLVLQFVMK
ncbi:MAG: preprotein translocase subunit SecE [Firmicutes bacterium]|nr:preprotein translocase subunit SecE [Candidatus Fermentithermobacillaceae bacterium]